MRKAIVEDGHLVVEGYVAGQSSRFQSAETGTTANRVFHVRVEESATSQDSRDELISQHALA